MRTMQTALFLLPHVTPDRMGQSVGCISTNDGTEVDGQPSQAKRQLYIGQDGVNYKREHMEVGLP
jgi:hypothetical protein